MEGQHGLVLRRRRDGHRLPRSSARWPSCLADPVGPIEEREAALREFDGYCFDRGWIPCLFAAGAGHGRPGAAASGGRPSRWPRTAWCALEHLEFKGKAWQDVRTAINKAGKQDIAPGGHARGPTSKPVVTDQLRAISGGWVVGQVAARDGLHARARCARPTTPTCACTSPSTPTSTIEGFTSWMPVGDDGEVVGWTLDLMRRRDEGFRPVMEFLIGASAMQFKEEGYQFISLSAAPLAKAPDAPGRQQRPAGAPEAARLPRRHARAVLRLPVAVRVQAEVPARAPPDVPGVPGRDRAGRDRHRHRPGLHARRRARRTGSRWRGTWSCPHKDAEPHD